MRLTSIVSVLTFIATVVASLSARDLRGLPLGGVASACTSTISGGLVAALDAAPAGATICLNSGTYASSALNTIAKAADVTVRPADGATVTITGLQINSCSHLRFTGLGGVMRIAGIDVDGPEGNPASTWMTFDHIEFTQAVSLRAREKNMHWLIDSSTFIGIHVALWEGALTVRGFNVDGDQGIVISNNLFQGDGAIDGTDGVQLIGGANGVIVRGNEFRRIDQHPSPLASHADPIQVYGASNIVVDGNYFHDNGGTGGFVDFDGPNVGMVITNNVFEAHRRGGFIYPWAVAANAAQGWLIEHNTIVGGGSVRIDGLASGNIVRNNLFVTGGLSLADGAVNSTTHDHNLNSGYTGTGNLTGTPIFVGGAAPTTYAGYVLAPGSIGRNASSTGSDMGINLAGSSGVLQFTASTLSVSESAGNALVSVSRSGGSSGAVSVSFATSGVTATAAADFIAQSSTLSWADGDSATKTISVPIINDALVEGDESFTITLTSPAGAALGATTTVTVTIVDDDVATAPDAPTIGATIPGNAQATIAFTAPLSNGGSPTTSYRVDCTANGQPVGSVNGTASPLTVTGLTNGVLYTCAAFAINAIGTSAASTNVTVTPSATAPLALTRVVSRKTHTGIDAFDVVIDSSLPITGPISVEPRAIGAGHTVHFQFNNAINSAGTLSVVDAASLPIPASVATAGNDVVVTIPALADSKRATISLIGVNGALNASASLGFLVGDVNESRTVNSSDISATKARSGQTTTALNFRFDVNTSGSINSSDISALKARSGVVLP